MRNDLTNMVIIEDDAGTFALTWFEHSIELTGKALSYLSNPNLAGHYLAPSVLIMNKIKITSNLNSHPNLFGTCPFRYFGKFAYSELFFFLIGHRDYPGFAFATFYCFMERRLQIKRKKKRKEKFDSPKKITAAFMSVFASHNVSYVHNVPSSLKNAHYLVDVHIF